MWLCLTPTRLCLDVTTWDASPWYWLLHAYLSPFSLYAMICLPCLFVPPLALFASLHTCLHVHAWVLLAGVSSMLQHNEVMDIRSKPTFVPRGPICSLVCAPLLLVCLLSSLFAYSFVCSNLDCCACRIYLACSLYVLLLLSTHFASITYLLVFLSLPFHVHTWSEDTWG